MKLPMRRVYLVHSICTAEAHSIIAQKRIAGMTDIQVAQEIYAHAVIYYRALRMSTFNPLRKYLLTHCDPIDLDNGGDTPFRQLCYRILWHIG